jgi:hypothetical protein
MAETLALSSEIDLLRRIYAAFNRRQIEDVLVAIHFDVDWPNGMEGGRVFGKHAVREYWRRQFEVPNPRIEPQGFTKENEGRVAVAVHQVVHDKSGKLLVDQVIQHVYGIRDGLIRNMEIRA